MAFSATNWAFLVAEDRGLFAQRGVRPSLSVSGDPETHAERLRSGAYDLAHQNADHVLRAVVDHGAQLVILMRLPWAPYCLVARPPAAAYRDLVGKRLVLDHVGVGHGLLFQRMLEANAVHEGTYVTIEIMSAAKRAAALLDGQADAGLFDPSTAAGLLRRGCSLVDVSEPHADGLLGPVVAARQDWLADHRDAAVAYVAAHLEAANWLCQPEKRAQAAEILARALAVDLEVAGGTYDLFAHHGDFRASERPVESAEVAALAHSAVGLERFRSDGPLLHGVADPTVLADAMVSH